MSQSWIFDQFDPWPINGQRQKSNVRDRSPTVSLTYESPSKVMLTLSAPWLQNKAPKYPKGRLWKLWEYEVVEVFISGMHETYLELEFGPFEHYLALGFQGQRQLVVEDYSLKELSFWRGDQDSDSPQDTSDGITYNQQLYWGARCELDLSVLPLPYQDSPRGWGVNAFWCFDSLGIKSSRQFCCASTLPGDQPDFHQPQYFPRWSPEELELS